MTRIPLIVLISCILINTGCKDHSSAEQASDQKLVGKKTQSLRTEVYSPEKELAGFSVPDGFVVELVASERDGIINPIDLTFDDAGRLWTQTATMYPLDPIADIAWNDLQELMEDEETQKNHPNFKRILDLYRGNTRGKDKILILSNFYNDDKLKVATWADGLAIPQSILPYKNGSFVAQGSELFFLSDTDNDGKADQRTPLFTGFGYTDTHTMAHTLLRGPADWIHFSHGALNKGEVTSLVSDAKLRIDFSKIARFTLDAKEIELVNSGLNNIWGFQLRGNGQWYGCEANDLGYSVSPMEPGTGYRGIGGERLRPYQPWLPELHDFRVGGTGISGLAFADDLSGSFSDEWKNVAFLANPITSKINAVRVIRNPDGSVTSEHLPDFLVSEDDWFRPVNMEFGPDGCLYIADWYNKIVSHNELPTTHPDRDKSHGRIWRIRQKSQQEREIPNFYEVPTQDLVNYLESPSLWAKRAAWHQICDRPFSETGKLANDLVALAHDNAQDEITRIHALWSLEGIYHYDEGLLKNLLNSTQDNLRREAVRSLASFNITTTEIASLLKPAAEDSNPMVRSQVLRTLDQIDTASAETIAILVSACDPPLEGNALGGAYERLFERYLARKALEKYPGELLKFVHAAESSNYQAPNLIWATQALPKQNREKEFLKLWNRAGYQTLDEPTFVIIAEMLNNPDVYKAVRPVLERTESAEDHVKFALNNLNKVQSDALARILTNPVRHLVTSNAHDQQLIGLEAAGKLNINSLNNEVLSLISADAPSETLKLIMLVLKNQPKENKAAFKGIASNINLEPELRASAVEILAGVDEIEAIRISSDMIPELNESQQQSVTKILSGSVEGSTVLKRLFEKGLINAQSFDRSGAERVFLSDEKDAVGQAIFSEVKKQLEEDQLEFETKLSRMMDIASSQSGDPEKGEVLFQTCLMCHRVEDKGFDFAPALDGSAQRENEALLTAILDPDAALESSYAVYRLNKTDGSTIEGYLVKKDERGTTLGLMGGHEIYVSTSEIRSQGYLQGRSFMVKGLLDSYTDDQIADLLAYIRILK